MCRLPFLPPDHRTTTTQISIAHVFVNVDREGEHTVAIGYSASAFEYAPCGRFSANDEGTISGLRPYATRSPRSVARQPYPRYGRGAHTRLEEFLASRRCAGEDDAFVLEEAKDGEVERVRENVGWCGRHGRWRWWRCADGDGSGARGRLLWIMPWTGSNARRCMSQLARSPNR